MKKVAVVLSSIALLLTATTVFAQSGIPVQVVPPGSGVNPFTSVSSILSNALSIIFIVAALAVLFMLIIGGFEWITSGGDKEKVGAARKRITAALIGLAILALAFVIVVVVGRVLNINILDLRRIPTLSDCPITGQRLNPVTGACETPAAPPTQ